MFSFLMMLFLLSIMAGFSSLIDSSFLGLLTNSTGPCIGYGFLTIMGDGFKLFSKNPWTSNLSVIFSFLIYNLETMSLNVMNTTLDTGLILLGLLGSSGAMMIMTYIYSFSGYSSLGSYSSYNQILIGEGMFFLLFLLVLSYTCMDYLFFYEQNYSYQFTFYTFYMFYIVFLLILLGESHPWDMPESESDLGGGVGMNLSSMYFMFFAMLEYSWVLMFLMLCHMVEWTIMLHLMYMYMLSGMMPSMSYKLFLEKMLFYFPVYTSSFLLLSLFSMMMEFCFLFSIGYL